MIAEFCVEVVCIGTYKRNSQFLAFLYFDFISHPDTIKLMSHVFQFILHVIYIIVFCSRTPLEVIVDQIKLQVKSFIIISSIDLFNIRPCVDLRAISNDSLDVLTYTDST